MTFDPLTLATLASAPKKESDTLVDVMNIVALPTGKKCRYSGQDIIAIIPTEPGNPNVPRKDGVQFQVAPGGLVIRAQAPSAPGEAPVIETLREPTLGVPMLLGALDSAMADLGFQRIGRHRDDMEGIPTGDLVYHMVLADGFQLISEVNLQDIVKDGVQGVEDTALHHRGQVFSYNSMLQVYTAMHLRLRELVAEGTSIRLDWPQMVMHHADKPRDMVLATIRNDAMDAYMGDDEDELTTLINDLTAFCPTHLKVEVDFSCPVSSVEGEPTGHLTLVYHPAEDDALTAASGSDDDDAPPATDGDWAMSLEASTAILDSEEQAHIDGR